MHESIRDGLEEYLKSTAGKVPREFHAHIEACKDCASKLLLLEAQAQMLRTLQTSREIEPRAGFYGRVMERINEERQSSIWAAFLEPAFGRRLAWISAAAVLALGTYLVTAELAEPQIAQAPSSIAANLPAPVLTANQPSRVSAASETSAVETAGPAESARQRQRRDAVLVNLASFRQ